MKKSLSFISFIVCSIIFTGCPSGDDRELVSDPAYYFTCEFEIENDSLEAVQVSCETANVFSDEALLMDDRTSVEVAANGQDSFSHQNYVALCAAPRLSFLLKINEDCYAGFDSSATSLSSPDSDEGETFLAKKYNLGLVDWTVSEKSPVWESSFSDYEKRIVQTGVTARYKIKIAEDGEVTIELLSLVTQ